MKKIILPAVFLLFSFITKAQNGKASENYFSTFEAGMSMSKNDSGVKQNSIDLRWNSVYGWFFSQVRRVQSLKKDLSAEKWTLATLGYGQQKIPDNGLNLVWGLGLTGIVVPDQTVTPKKNKLFIGGGVYGHLGSEESNFELELSGNYAFLPPNSSYDWSHTMGLIDFGGIYYFGKVVGIGANYKLKLDNISERQIQGNQFNGYSSTESFSTINPFVALRASSMFTLKAGVELKRMKNSFSQNNYSPQFYAEDEPSGINIRAIFTFKNSSRK